jgi:hypothetical protein
LLALTSDERVTLIAATATLAGVIIGGLITTGTTVYFERRREGRNLRQARRLVAEEIRAHWGQLEAMIQDGTYPRPAEDLLPTRQWANYRATLARYLHDYDWDRIAPYMEAGIPTMRLMIQRATPLTSIAARDLEQIRAHQTIAGIVFTMLTGRLVID